MFLAVKYFLLMKKSNKMAKDMEMDNIRAVIGTNSWGSKLYGKLLRGSYVSETVIKEAVEKAKSLGVTVLDTAQDYGLGKCQPIIGRVADEQVMISSKYTPMTGKYKDGQVRKSLEKDLRQMNCKSIDIYWLHLPNAIRQNMKEIIGLYQKGRIRNIGVSNFTLEECKMVKSMLDDAGIPLYGVQNHYSLINRDWEKEGLLSWCKENNISFWAWAVLEEGILAGPRKKESFTIMKAIYAGRRRKLERLYTLMEKIGEKYSLSIAQVAMAFVASKGIVPVCGCRKPKQVTQLYQAVDVRLTAEEMTQLEKMADEINVKVFGKDVFRFAAGK